MRNTQKKTIFSAYKINTIHNPHETCLCYTLYTHHLPFNSVHNNQVLVPLSYIKCTCTKTEEKGKIDMALMQKMK